MDRIAPDGLLADLGITQSCDQVGNISWNLEIVIDGIETRLACFDKELGKWKLESATQQKSLTLRPKLTPTSSETEFTSLSKALNWTDDLYTTDHVDLFRKLDWGASPLGHYRTWPHSLRLYTHMLFSDSRAAAIYWGPKRIAIYNEHLPSLIGALDPTMMTSSIGQVMPSLWDLFGQLFLTIEKEQHGFARKGLELSFMRNGFLEETWWDGGLVSLKDDDGNHGGVYFSWVEVTRTKLRDRRTSLINRLGHSQVVSTKLIWQHIYEVFQEYPLDIPMAIMYSTQEGSAKDGLLRLEHTIGIGAKYAAAPNYLDLESTSTDALLAPLLRRAMSSAEGILVVDSVEEEVDQALFTNVDWLGFGEPSRYLVVITLRARGVDKGHIILGLNPRRDYDTDHKQFVTDIARHLREIATRVTAEEELQMREDQLLIKLGETERRLSRFAEIAPVGIYDFAPTGQVVWANSHFYDILGVPEEHRGLSFVWKDYILPEDHEFSDKEMIRSLIDGVEISGNLRLKRRYSPPQIGLAHPPTDVPFWVLHTASPDVGADGMVQSLKGSLTDISHLKWIEHLHVHNAEVALRDKKRQEEFIDITSHEMRNPLSAITQCADSVILSYEDAKLTMDNQSFIEIIKLNAEAAESILLCAAHQRRIIDDILTLGKLDSELLTICPLAFYPFDLLDHAAQMFKTEFEVQDIDAKRSVDETSPLTVTSTVLGDSSRLMQILVNLLTNAIKFTKTRRTRSIMMRFGSSPQPPSADLFGLGFAWHSTGIARPDMTQETDYGQGEEVYLYFAIVDSGSGVPADSQSKVFAKFEQAERRTHTKYGGSGLGLYISRELAELQGGQIGMSSEYGVGSTFAFYTKARMSVAQKAVKTGSASSTNTVASTAKTHPRPQLPSPQLSIPPPLPRHSILLVEDNLLNQKVLAKQLTRSGCTVHVCSNGGEAIDTILTLHNEPIEFDTPPSIQGAAAHFDCILMDWEMPICDGLRATKRIREIEKQLACTPNVIVGVTANARAGQIAMAMEAGMDTVVPKPFRVQEILAVIGGMVG
ncbi:hypothetical protein HBI24_075380 [Parastagonospora nodorum]|nr:hypothetical protein HBH53_148480 [Parastagonospora nodorum]KAH3967049.1 hypothetical protein HBH51_139890 [Parastagonospora nodorum]KAH4026913.1 hypothetical protein HBI09_145710 [Parastagonospora nodorum]KAH4088619.1 hypothetical protein HBH46_195400 [Parastagonospora nodorum]KAH5003978.1 hypothetical protein HBI77_124990 [Parastagonospora nodorum]